MAEFFIKDPQAVLDFSCDWESWLAGDTLASSLWLLPEGITKAADTYTDTVATVWLSGGTLRETYKIVNRIQTTGGRVDDRTLLLYIEEK